MLGTAYGKFIIDNLLYKVLFEHPLELLSGILFGKLPFAESPVKWVIHGIHAVSRPLFAQSTLLQPAFPLIKSLGNDLKVRVAEEQADNSSMHLALLLVRLLRYVIPDVLLAVSLSPEEVFESFDMTAYLISL